MLDAPGTSATPPPLPTNDALRKQAWDHFHVALRRGQIDEAAEHATHAMAMAPPLPESVPHLPRTLFDVVLELLKRAEHRRGVALFTALISWRGHDALISDFGSHPLAAEQIQALIGLTSIPDLADVLRSGLITAVSVGPERLEAPELVAYCREHTRELDALRVRLGIQAPATADLLTRFLMASGLEAPKRMAEEEIQVAEAHIRQAVGGAITVGIITAGFAIFGELVPTMAQATGIDAWGLGDAALILLLAYGIHKNGRASAVLLCSYYIAGKVVGALFAGQIAGFALTIFFAFLFVRGAIAVFRVHEHQVTAGLIKAGKPYRWLIALGVVGALFFAGLVWIGLNSPGDEVVAGPMLKKKYVAGVRELGLLDEGETILYWYSNAVIDFRNSFTFLSNYRLVSYDAERAEPAISIPLATVQSAWLDPQEELGHRRLVVVAENQEELWFLLATKHDGDKKFLERLTTLIRK